jgi:hypothetical protein
LTFSFVPLCVSANWNASRPNGHCRPQFQALRALYRLSTSLAAGPAGGTAQVR